MSKYVFLKHPSFWAFYAFTSSFPLVQLLSMSWTSSLSTKIRTGNIIDIVIYMYGTCTVLTLLHSLVPYSSCILPHSTGSTCIVYCIMQYCTVNCTVQCTELYSTAVLTSTQAPQQTEQTTNLEWRLQSRWQTLSPPCKEQIMLMHHNSPLPVIIRKNYPGVPCRIVTRESGSSLKIIVRQEAENTRN